MKKIIAQIIAAPAQKEAPKLIFGLPQKKK